MNESDAKPTPEKPSKSKKKSVGPPKKDKPLSVLKSAEKSTVPAKASSAIVNTASVDQSSLMAGELVNPPDNSSSSSAAAAAIASAIVAQGSTPQLPASTSISAVPPSGSASPASIMTAAVEAATKNAEKLASSGGLKSLPPSLSVHPILRGMAPSTALGPSLATTMSLTALAAAAATPTSSGLHQGLSPSQRWPPHLNTLNALAEISGQRLSAPGAHAGSNPPPYANLNHPSIPPALSVIRKPGPFSQPPHTLGAPPLTLAGSQYQPGSPGRTSVAEGKAGSGKGNKSSSLAPEIPHSANILLGSGGGPVTLPSSKPLSSGQHSPDLSKSVITTNVGRAAASSPTPVSLSLSSSQPVSTTAAGSKPLPTATLIPGGLGSPYSRFPEHFPGHSSFPGYPPRLHGPARHPPPLHAAPGRAPLPPSMYPGVPHGAYPPLQSPHHPGVLRGPHDLYKPPPHPSHSSPSHHSPHPQLMMKSYPGMEHLNYPGSPGRLHSPHESPTPSSPLVGGEGSEELERVGPPLKRPDRVEPSEFSSGLMSYFSSQREEDME
ncbi:hypothetical protein HAZT_HAZT007131 [Hyalella azteca]|uniref:Uncharacterized protein n=1 Tax=Hyalella azteca TaxID=294128 RepID=A0A6A0HF66_HYAAZ|nr:hypothetical protein HAZT_HAZT007131 [Hyalella azteca]